MSKDFRLQKLKSEISLKISAILSKISSNRPEISFDPIEQDDITIEPEHIELTIYGRNSVLEKRKNFPIIFVDFSRESMNQLEKDIEENLL